MKLIKGERTGIKRNIRKPAAQGKGRNGSMEPAGNNFVHLRIKIKQRERVEDTTDIRGIRVKRGKPFILRSGVANQPGGQLFAELAGNAHEGISKPFVLGDRKNGNSVINPGSRLDAKKGGGPERRTRENGGGYAGFGSYMSCEEITRSEESSSCLLGKDTTSPGLLQHKGCDRVNG